MIITYSRVWINRVWRARVQCLLPDYKVHFNFRSVSIFHYSCVPSSRRFSFFVPFRGVVAVCIDFSPFFSSFFLPRAVLLFYFGVDLCCANREPTAINAGDNGSIAPRMVLRSLKKKTVGSTQSFSVDFVGPSR